MLVHMISFISVIAVMIYFVLIKDSKTEPLPCPLTTSAILTVRSYVWSVFGRSICIRVKTEPDVLWAATLVEISKACGELGLAFHVKPI